MLSSSLQHHAHNLHALLSPPHSLHSHLRKRYSKSCICAFAPSEESEVKVLILGATGRVGGSTASALSRLCPNVKLFLAGRNRVKGEELSTVIDGNTAFVEVDIDDKISLGKALHGKDIVIHAAGPFQRKEHCNVLELAIENKVSVIPGFIL